MAVQSLSAAHATTYGDSPHQHEGVLCAVSVASSECVAPLPAIILTDYVGFPVKTDFVQMVGSAPYGAPQGRAPPPRAPPFNQ
ncbi:hypothetical protein [Litorimonas haliclonae]|uniref:hypothetical protein n=1 Tax=Litorimonas haliclonae TaxID=2081977 RepID=UPI0039EF108B